jgi:hypothetical protein
VTDLKEKDVKTGQSEPPKNNGEGKTPASSTTSEPPKPTGTGELVAPSDPRAGAEIEAMVAEIIGKEPSAQEVLQAIVGGESLPESTAEQSQAGIVARILAADSPEAALDMGEPVKAEELEQVVLNVSGVRWMRSTFEEGPGVYAVIDAVREDTEEAIKATCGSVNVMTQLLKLQTMAAFPQRVKIVKSQKPTQSGYYPFWLQPA